MSEGIPKFDAGKMYDRIYSEKDKLFGVPSSVVTRLTKYIKEGRALDLGAGQGRNSVWLAQQGFNVEARDISEQGVNAIQQNAVKSNVSIETIKSDAREGLDKAYDAILLINLLHFMNRADALKVIEDVKEHTVPNGINIVNAFTKKGDFYAIPGQANFFFAEIGEIKELYKDWNILEYREYETKAVSTREDGTFMVNLVAEIIAQKPK